MTEPQKPKRRRRWTRRIVLALLVLLVVGGAAAILAPQLIPESAMRRQVRTLLEKQLGRPVTLDSAWFGWGEGLHVTGLRIGSTPLAAAGAATAPGKAAPAASPDLALATARQLVIGIDPSEVARGAAGNQVALNTLRLEGLELWLILGADGRTNVDDMASSPMKVQSIQLTGATLHIDNLMTGRRLTFHNVSTTLGELATTGRGYASLSADIEAGPSPAPGAPSASPPPARLGHIMLTANLSKMDFSRLNATTGSLKAEWTDVAWSDVVATAAVGSPLETLMSHASGRMTATFGRGAWSAEGALDMAELRVTGHGPWAEAVMPQAILGFDLQQDAPDKPVKINLLKFSAPGVDLNVVAQQVQFEKPPALALASATPTSAAPSATPTTSGAATSSTAASAASATPTSSPAPPAPVSSKKSALAAAAKAAPPAPSESWAIRDAKLRCTGTITWLPLAQSIAPLKRFTENLERFGGGARVDLTLTVKSDGPRLTGALDLTDTQVTWHNRLRKDLLQTLRIEVDASAPRGDLATLDLTSLDIVTEAGRVSLHGRIPTGLASSAPPAKDAAAGGGPRPAAAPAAVLTPSATAAASAAVPTDSTAASPDSSASDASGMPAWLAAPKPAAAPTPTAGPLAGAFMEIRANITQAEKLLVMAPVIAEVLGPLDVYGPLNVQLTLHPGEPPEAAPRLGPLPSIGALAPPGASPAAGSSLSALAPPAARAPSALSMPPSIDSRPDFGLTGSSAARFTSALEMPMAGARALAAVAGPAIDSANSQAWTARLHADLTGLGLAGPEAEGKRSGKRASVDAMAMVDLGARRLDLRTFRARLDQATVAWAGSARVEWPMLAAGSPVGHFDGTLNFAAIESAGAILVPHLFAAGARPLAGEAAVKIKGDLRQDLSSRQAPFVLTAELAANLNPLVLHFEKAIEKRDDQPALLTVAGQWQSGSVNHVILSADLQLAAAKFTASGQGDVSMQWLRPQADRDAAAVPGAQPSAVIASEPSAPVIPSERSESRNLAATDTAASISRRDPSASLGATTKKGLTEVSGEQANRVAAAAAGAAPVEPPASGLRIRFAPGSTFQVGAKVSDLARAVEVCPALVQALQGYRAEGAVEATALVTLRASAVRIGANVNFTDAALDLATALKKPTGRPMTVDLAMDITAPQQQAVELHVANIEARLGDSSARAKGWVRLSQPSLVAALAGPAHLAALIQEADFEVFADWQHNPDLRQALPWLEPLYTRSGLAGPMHLVLAVQGTPLSGQIRFDADATGCRIFNADTLLKPAGTPATVTMALKYGQVPGEMILDKLAIRLADATATVDGRLLFDNPRLTTLAPPTAWSFHTAGRVPDAAILASLFPARLADLKPAGALAFDLRASADAKGAEVESCRLTFSKARAEWLGRQVILDGPFSYDSRRLATDGLSLVAGGSDLKIVDYIDHPNDDKPTGSVSIRGKQLDLQEAANMLQQTSAYLEAKTAEVLGKAGAQRPDKAFSDRLALQAQRLLAGARLSADVAIDRVSFAVPEWNTTYELLNMVADGRLAERRFVIPRFQCRMNDGAISGEVVLDFRQAVPLVSYAYDARDLKMAPNLKPFIDTTFPGMQVFGTLTTHGSFTQRLVEHSTPVGKGETIVTDGLLVGPAAPEYITKMLPGLKLTEYRFTWMSNVYERLENGNIDNRMLFKGKAYDIYLFGLTHPDGRFEYTLGVDLALSLGSKELSRTLDQGKLPLMNYTGRIVGSHMAEEHISYVLLPQFTYDVFVRQSILLKLIKQIGEKPPEIQRPPVVPDVKTRTTPE